MNELLEQFMNYLRDVARMARHANRCKEFKYSCNEGFVLEEGRLFEKKLPKPYPELGTPKECFRNASLLTFEKGFTYVEGFALSKDGILPTLHAWVVNPEGFVVETTWEDVGDIYYGVAFNQKYLSETLVRQGFYGLIDQWHSGFPLLRGKEIGYKETL